MAFGLARWVAVAACAAFWITQAMASSFAVDVGGTTNVCGALSRADGRVIRGARFRVEVYPDGSDEVVAATEDTDVTGQYRVRVPYAGRWRLRAYAAVPAAGRYDRVEMEPVGGAVLTAGLDTPAVKDFRLRAPGLQR